MITYKYKLYRNKANAQLEKLLREACFVWNHCLALQKRYYALYGKYANAPMMQKHFAKRFKMNTMAAQSVQEVIQRLDNAYQRFFKHTAKRPPKFKRKGEMSSVVFKQNGFVLKGNKFTVNKLQKTFKFSLYRPMKGSVKRLSVKKSPLGEYFICIATDAEAPRRGKTHDGASVGIDFGLKTYLTLSDGTRVENPEFLKRNLAKLRKASQRLSRSMKGSHHREERKKEVNRCYEKVTNSRTDWQWKMAQQVCRAYDNIFVEDLVLDGMCRRWGRKMHDLAHGKFVEILEVVAAKYGCTVHRIDRFYPSSKMCECGFKNDKLKLSDREWICPQCGRHHDRDVNAARNILRRGIDELVSTDKSADREVIGVCD
jgi:putative transposase